MIGISLRYILSSVHGLRWREFCDGTSHDDPPPHSPVVWVSLKRLDRSWRKDNGYYVGYGGTGQSTSPGKYRRFEKWLKQSLPVDMPEICFNEGHVTFTDGRHRTAWFRDHGLAKMPMSVCPECEDIIKQRFGVLPDPRQTIVTLKT